MNIISTHRVLLLLPFVAARLYAVNPAIIAQQAYIKASNAAAADDFGSAVAISGDTVVIGAQMEDSSATGVNGNEADNGSDFSGAVYVMVRDASGNWTQQAYLKASNTQSNDLFGCAVAISGDTLVVGALNENSNATGVNGNQADNSALYSGAAYVFTRNGTTWTQEAYLKASNTGTSDNFGQSVAISGDTIVVGALLEDSNATGVNGNQTNNLATSSGAAYVFTRSGTTWTQEAYLKASNTGSADRFGCSVAISGDIVAVGAFFEDSFSIPPVLNQNDNSAPNAGAVYTFSRSGTTWTQSEYLKSSNTGANDEFGCSVALSGNTLVVGAKLEDSSATGVDGNQGDESMDGSGAAYVFFWTGHSWMPQGYIKASNTGANDHFGYAVAVSGDTLVVGANAEASAGTGINGNQSDNSAIASGAAYVFTRSGDIWTQQAYLKASNTGANDQFGCALAISGDTVVVGARVEGSNAIGVNGNQADDNAYGSGAAYVLNGFGPCSSLALEQPPGTTLAKTVGSASFVSIPGSSSSPRTFTIRSGGSLNLDVTTVTTVGGNASEFLVSTDNLSSPILPTQTSTFTVTFMPLAVGNRSTTLRILSNAPNENPFDVILNGLAYSFTEDTDGDGLNDASEHQMAALGFDPAVSQIPLVNMLMNNANGAGLYTLQQVKALNVDAPLIQQTAPGQFKLTIGIEKSTTLDPQSFTPLPMTAPKTVINGAGKLEFLFTSPDNAAFYRLQAQ